MKMLGLALCSRASAVSREQQGNSSAHSVEGEETILFICNENVNWKAFKLIYCSVRQRAA